MLRTALFAVVFLAWTAPLHAAEQMYQSLEGAASRCGVPPGVEGKPRDWSKAQSEDERRALSAAIFLGLHDFTGSGRGATKEAATCPVARFEADSIVWTLATGALPLVATTPEEDTLFYLQRAPALKDASDWIRVRQGFPANTAPPLYLLVLKVDNEEQAVVATYDHMPTPRQFAKDIADAFATKAPILASYQRAGGTVNLKAVGESAPTAELFAAAQVSVEHPAVLWGPDGLFFRKDENNNIVFRGSGFVCLPEYNGFARDTLEVMSSPYATLDLGCTLRQGDSFVSISVTRMPDAKNDKTYYADRLRSLMAFTKGVKETVSKGGGRRSPIQMSQYWLGSDGRAYSVILARRAEYIFDVLTEGPPKEYQAATEAAIAIVEQISAKH